ncbi:MAG: cytochrome c oxidase subunit I [Methanobacteriota archaeon]|nr:MAG: cytochrome c oxidase subunit I [Euryarchaeota archaeon]
MNKNRIRVISLMLVIFAALAATPQITSFPTGAGTNGNNGCTCHAGGAGTTTVTVEGLPESYVGGETYELMLTVSNPDIPGADISTNMGGFRLFASAGTFGPGENSTDLVQEKEGGATHTELGNDFRTWNISWTAPDNEGQIVDFTAHGNAVNGNAVTPTDGKGNTGDAWGSFETSIPGAAAMGGGVALIEQAEPFEVAIAAITFGISLFSLMLVYVFYRNNPDGFNINGLTTWLKKWLTTTDHKEVGTLYFVFSFLFLLIGGVFAMLFRLQLAVADNEFLTQDQYNSFFTLHGTTMIFLAAMPMIAAFANWILPLQIGAKDLAFPRINAMGFWMLVGASVLLYGGVLAGEGADISWTMYAPYSASSGEKGASAGTTLFIGGIIMLGISSTLGGVNFIATVMTMRAPGVTWMKMPLFTWSVFVANAMLYLSLPALIIGTLYLFLDRTIGTHFYDAAAGGDPILWAHLFWYFGHPEVYVLILPAFGIVSEVLATSAKRSIFGYRSMVYAMAGIGALGFIVWGHHMLTSGMDPTLRLLMMITTMLVAIPTGVKIFNWLATLWGGSLVFKTHTLWALGFLVTFTIGGISGMFFPVAGLDVHFHDTYFVVAHFHYVIVGGTIFGMFSAIYYWYPKATGRKLDEKLGLLHFVITFIAMNGTFWPMHQLGIEGMPRRYHTYSVDSWTELNTFITISAYIMGIAQLILLWNLIRSYKYGEEVGKDPWGGWSLEWTTESPPPTPSFHEIPTQGDANEHEHESSSGGLFSKMWKGVEAK